jgi:FkbM family methyltransferase
MEKQTNVNSKKYFAKLYNKVYRLLQGSGLSKFQSIRRIHIFFTKKVKSEFVDFYGLKLYLTENDSENYSGGINYEDDYFDLLELEITSGENVIDIGAKIGIYSLAFSKLIGPTGKVFSFEPTPNSFNILKKNMNENHLENMIIEQKAVTDKNETQLLELFESSGNNRINNDSKNSININCTSLDNYFSDRHEKISFVKIDVEGLESKVLSGMKNVLEKNPKLKILLEYNPKLMKFYGYVPEKILEDLTKQGFSLFDLEYDYKIEQNVEHFIKLYNNTHKLTNILAKKIVEY